MMTYYVASLKGKLLSSCPEARIVDINHKVKAFQYCTGSFYCEKQLSEISLKIPFISLL